MIAASEGIDPGALAFAFRPLWQLDAASAATVALQKAQATQIYAGLNLWPAATTATLVAAQLAADGTYPNASAVLGEGDATLSAAPTLDYDPDQPRDGHGRWTAGGGLAHAGEMLLGGSAARSEPASPHRATAAPPSPGGILGFLNALNPIGTAQAQEIDPEEENRRDEEFEREPGEVLRLERWAKALETLRDIDPENPHLRRLEPPDYVPTDADIVALEQASREALIARTCGPLRPRGGVEPTFESSPPSSLVPARPPPTTAPPSQGSTPPSKALLTAAAEVAAHLSSEAQIQFGRDANQTYHAFRHVDALGLDRQAIENAIRNDLADRSGLINQGLYNGSVKVDGIDVGYAAYKLPDGTINVGRITPPRGK